MCGLLSAPALAYAEDLPPMTVSDLLLMGTTEVEACGRREFLVQVTFNVPWVENSFFATDVGDPDGAAAFFTSFDESSTPQVLKGVRPGDVVQVLGRPCRMQLEPGVDVDAVRVVSHEELPSPRPRSVLDITAGHCNNRRARIRGVVMESFSEYAADKPLETICVSTEDGEISVRIRGELVDGKSMRDAEIEVDGVVVPVFNPKGEFFGAEIEAFGKDSIRITKKPPEDPFDVPECDTAALLAWTPQGRQLHSCRIFGEVTCVVPEESAFALQRGKTAVRIFTDGELPKVGEKVEAAGFAVRRDECGALVGSVWRGTSAAVEPVELYRLSLAPGSVYDLGGFMADNDLQFRLVEVTGRIVDVHEAAGANGRLLMEVDGRSVDVVLPDGGLDGLPRGLADEPMMRIRGVLDAHVSLGRASGRLFSFEGFHLRTRGVGDFVLVPDWHWIVRRAARFAWIGFLAVMLAFGAFVAVVALRRHRVRVGAEAIAADRRRIAAELHDTISQHISGAKLWVYSAKMAAGDTLAPQAADALVMAESVLEATRREIRDAIMDLQSDEFVSESPEQLLRRICRGMSVPGKTRVRCFTRGLPADLPIRVKRDLLAVASEAVGNAIKHGEAKNVIVVSEGNGKGDFVLDVLNDGRPFAVDSAPGPEKGHFGISNMKERAERSGMALTFGEKRGYVAVTLERKGR